MKAINETLRNAFKEPTTQRKGKILVNENFYEVYNVEYFADCYNDGNVIGNCIASQLDFDLPYMPKFDTFKYYDGIWTGSEYEYIDLGTFTVFDERDEDEFNKHITAFDNLIKFNKEFVSDEIYPKTLYQELQNVCNQAGVALNNLNITNGDFIIEDNQFVNGETLKTVLKAICQMSGTYGIIKNDELVLQLKNQTNETLTKNHHEPITWKRRTYGINQLILGLSDVEGEYVIRQDDEDIAINGVHKLVINDNPFSYTQEKRDELIDELFAQVKGFGYVPYEMNGEWLSYLEIGDTINIDDIETMVLRIVGMSPKSLESTISAPSIIDSSIVYLNNTASVKNTLKKTEISVNKQNQTITSISKSVDEQNEKITETIQTVDGMQTTVENTETIAVNSSTKVNELETNLNNNYLTTDQIQSELNTQKDDIDLIKQQQTKFNQTATNLQASITEIVNGGTQILKNTMVTIDIEGIKVATNLDKFSSLLNNKGLFLYGYGYEVARFTNEGTELDNLTVRNYLTAGYHRTEKYIDENGKKWTAQFWIGD